VETTWNSVNLLTFRFILLVYEQIGKALALSDSSFDLKRRRGVQPLCLES